MEAAVFGIQRVQALMARLEKALDADEVLDDGSAILLNRIRTRFLAQQSPSGERWEESQAAKRRRAQGRGGGTLYDTGALFHALRVYDRGNDSRAIAVDPTARNPRTNQLVAAYAIKHQRGRDGHLQRRFLGFNDDDSRAVGLLVVKRVKDAINGQT